MLADARAADNGNYVLLGSVGYDCHVHHFEGQSESLGIFYAGFILFELIMNIITVACPYVILMDTSAIVAAALIAWYSWKWPK